MVNNVRNLKTIAGVTSGVGSMLIGAKRLGLEVLGNVEWRNYYNTGTFENYFNAPYTTDYNDIEHLKGADIVMVHDDCGSFSNLNPHKKSIVASECRGLIPETVKAVKEISPRFFAMDNLPKLFLTFPASYWIEEFPEYDIFFEFISNYNYGNTQKNRKRLFIIGAKKEENFVFKNFSFSIYWFGNVPSGNSFLIRLLALFKRMGRYSSIASPYVSLSSVIGVVLAMSKGISPSFLSLSVLNS